MESTIKKIYEKELGFRESEYEDKEYTVRREEYNKAYETLEDALNDEQKKMLWELFICGGGVQGAAEYLSFKDGFFAGLRLGIELCEEKE